MDRIDKLISEISDEKEREETRKKKYKNFIEKGSLTLRQKALCMLFKVYNIYHKSIHCHNIYIFYKILKLSLIIKINLIFC